MKRMAEVARATKETNIRVRWVLDGAGHAELSTGIGFFDHMLDQLARHGGFDLFVHAEGDLHVDMHHTVEDVGICLGEALHDALGDKKGIARFGFFYAPLDEALARAVVDLSGRPGLVYAVELPRERIGEMDAELFREFFQAFANHARCTLHLDLLRGVNAHHMIEAVFKAFARALKAAVAIDPNARGIPSTKGAL
ncbi:MAG: imidazoleglycerol-phosphate dehydratase HisB [Zetaproteobacteria bacterium]|nr:MAG: imidazoleglycerol-phosphate dehydratase HisB [Zetaproteobacteria bacterium]